jgi:hypothetical protein
MTMAALTATSAVLPNNESWRGQGTGVEAATKINLIRTTTANKIEIDASGFGTIFYGGIGAVTMGALLATSIQGLNLLTMYSGSYPSSYPTTLSVGSSADGKLQLGNNAHNEIVGGSTSAGGYLRFWVNNTSAYNATPNGILVLTLANTGAATFASTVSASNEVKSATGFKVTASATAETNGYVAFLESDYGPQSLRLSSRSGKVLTADNYGSQTNLWANNIVALYADASAKVDLPVVGASVAGSLILTLGNVGTNAATLQAAVASATAPKVGTYAQMIAWTVAAGTTPYWYATDVTETDGLLGKLYQWSGSAWVAVGTPQTVVGRVIAGVISAGAVGAQAIAADVALIGQVLRSTGFTAGTSSVAPSGFKFSGTAFTATLLDGTTLSVFGELGADLSIGGLKAAVIANRVRGNLFTRNTAGTTDVFIPDGVVSIEVTLQATGGNGASSYGTGGGGGQYIKANVTVKPHNTYRLTLGAAGSNSTFSWVSFDGTSGFTTDSGFSTVTATCGAAGTAGSGSGANGADVGFSFPGPESSWNSTGSAAGDGLPAGAISQAGRGGNIYGLGSGGNGAGTTATKAGGGGGGASATGSGGNGSTNPLNGSAGTSGGGGGGGAAGGAGGVGFVRAKW